MVAGIKVLLDLVTFGFSVAQKDKDPIPPLRKDATPEEKEAYANQQKSNNNSNIARRKIALYVTATWMVYLLLPIGWEMLGNSPLSSIEKNSNYIHGVFAIILSAYFMKDKMAGAFDIIGNVLKKAK